MSKFAKIFETKEHGQILVKLDENEKGPEVRFYFRATEFGLSSVGITHNDTDSGWNAAESFFKGLEHVDAVRLVEECKVQLRTTTTIFADDSREGK